MELVGKSDELHRTEEHTDWWTWRQTLRPTQSACARRTPPAAERSTSRVEGTTLRHSPSRTARAGHPENRANSLVFRIRFAFLVGHPLPLVVSQYRVHAQSCSPPRTSRLAPLTHPAGFPYLSNRTSYAVHGNPVGQPRRRRQPVLLQESVELGPVHSAVLNPATEATLPCE